MSTHGRRMSVATTIKFILFSFVITVGFILVRLGNYIVQGMQLQREAPFLNPSGNINEEDLLGIWQVRYMEWGTDTITLKQDGTFNQKYIDNYVDNGSFVFESSDNPWRIERLSDGRLYLRLQGGKYFLEGVSFAKRIDQGYFFCREGTLPCSNKISLPIYLYDWIGHESVKINGELILNVRTTPSGEILLLHLWDSSDQGFPLIGGEAEIFRRVFEP